MSVPSTPWPINVALFGESVIAVYPGLYKWALHSYKTGDVTKKAEIRVRWPQAKECWGHQKLEEARNRLSPNPSGWTRFCQLLDFELLASSAVRKYISFVWNHPVCGYFYLWKSYETGMTTNSNVAYFPGSRKARKMIVQTEAKLNKLLDEFVEEKQNNLHRETCVFFQPEPQPNPDRGWAWNIAFFSLPCLLSPTSVSAFALWCCKWLCGWTTLKTNTPMEAAFSSSQGKTPRSWMLWKALAFRDAVGWPGTFIRALNLILSWVRCYITETWKTFWIYVKDFLHSSVSL